MKDRIFIVILWTLLFTMGIWWTPVYRFMNHEQPGERHKTIAIITEVRVVGAGFLNIDKEWLYTATTPYGSCTGSKYFQVNIGENIDVEFFRGQCTI